MMKRMLLASTSITVLAASAMAADLTPPPALPPPPPPLWTGFYIGINAGYEWENSQSVDVLTVPVAADPAFAGLANASLHSQQNGFIGGGQIGYNYQFANSWVVGLEADLDGLATSHRTESVATFGTVGGASVTTGINASKNIDYLGTVRGRIGYLVIPTLLVFGDGGLAYGGVSTGLSIVQTSDAGLLGVAAGYPRTNAQVGWTAGGGVEWMFMPNWSAKVEYLYYNLGTVTNSSFLNAVSASPLFSYAWSQAKAQYNGNVVRAGINYHFNWGTPVVAKY